MSDGMFDAVARRESDQFLFRLTRNNREWPWDLSLPFRVRYYPFSGPLVSGRG
jgi:hypothetical protein